jgi:protein SCO1/2
MNLIKFVFAIITFYIISFNAFSAQDNQTKLGIEEKLNSYVPMDLTFTDSDGKLRQLKDIIKIPTILSLVYYRCPGICSPMLTSMAETMGKLNMKPGVDFQGLTISFNHKEDYTLAAGKKKNYLANMNKPIPPEDWIWMAGDSVSIRKLTDAVGFYFKKDSSGEFIHTGALIILAPDGKITRYLNGTDFLVADLEMALREAAKGEARPTISKLIAWCFSYDPEGKRYIFDINKVAGTIIFLGIGTFFVVLLVKGRKKSKEKPSI